MTDTNSTPAYDPTDIEATRGREQGLGVGQRDLDRQGDVGNTVAAPEEDRDFQSAGEDTDDDEALDENTSVLGTDEDDTGYGSDDEVEDDVTDDGEVIEEDGL